nr:putative Dol-P-Glc:Glc(2)Man(9)GlcNAc(2)-PP-Dol alpha-1,2-glucosyltransferase isoform X2 [Crassostrea virginica]XP_022296843.1 putative Dol-P-Glc:Glc(2)Man(9)GlcNAc(2)-PP-Dol alpha-1,2-glucosyltransferase isoform X2 [Crassostrea virginica]XP_022296846.1 putative Dol-P-Glc:Glc(2)Man(9)GlcNAc(2)-PP-Dol alpha-1,2-glucosyltransferase isoform X2 [Crassostrea virginica]
MITTLPGLYLVTVGILRPLTLLLGADMVCSVTGFRLINILFQSGTFYVLKAIYGLIHSTPTAERGTDKVALMTAVTLTFFPLLHFFTFLYYTDPGSTFFVLLMYLFHLQGNKTLAAFMGGMSILFRQTNVVWVVFVAGLMAADIVQEWMNNHPHFKKKDKNQQDSLTDIQTIQSCFKLVVADFKYAPQNLVKLIGLICVQCIHYIIIIGLFGLFVYLNEGIVVGDRSQHEACLNFPQVFYFVSFTVLFLSPYMIRPSRIVDFILFSVKNITITVGFLAVSYALVNKYTHVHLYLISDNRHYTFYVWSKIYERFSFMRYALILPYYYGIFSLLQSIRYKNIFWKLVFIICLFVSTIPQKLLEFRYFILPYLIYRLNVKYVSWREIALEMMIYMAINVFTIYMFIAKPFQWGENVELQRFMW